MGAARLLLSAGLVLPAALAATEQGVFVGSLSAPTKLLTPVHFQLEKGDILNFTWRSIASNLSVLQSSQTEPCTPQLSGFNSGFQESKEGDDNDSWSFKVAITNDTPIFFYVVDGNTTAEQHCVEGTYGSVNAESTHLKDFERLAAAQSAFPVQTTPTPTATKSFSTGTGASPTRTGSPGRNKDEDGQRGLSAGTIAAIVAVSIFMFGALFWLLRRRRTRQRQRAVRRPTRDSIIDPPPAYVAVQPASISAGSQMTEVWEEVGGRTIMRAPSVSSQPGASSHTSGSSTSGSRTASSSEQTATLDTNPFASPDDDETTTLRSSSRPASPAASDEDAPPEYMSSHSVPPPFSPVARR